MMQVAIIDYGSGNLRSAAKALERAAAEAEVPCRVLVTARAEDAAAAERIVLPGVGAFAACQRGLAAVDGMIAALEEAVIRRAQPFLGICVGMQLMATTGREHGAHAGLGWIPGEVTAIEPGNGALKVPHMGWNGLTIGAADHPVLADLAADTHVYFVHSYEFRPSNRRHVLASAEYGGAMAAVVGRDNLLGTQFHPEKSQAAGLRLLGNFLRWRP